MNWLSGLLRVAPEVAALIAADLRRVAAADQNLHEREQGLIDAFEQALPAGTVAAEALPADEEIRLAWLRALVMLAMADGELSEEEIETIEQLVEERGVTADVAATTAQLKRSFFGSSAREAFRVSFQGLAQSLGLSDDADEVWN